MNLVSVLIAPAIVTLSVGADANAPMRFGIAGVAFVIVVGAVAVSKRRDLAIGNDDDPDSAIAEERHPQHYQVAQHEAEVVADRQA